MQRTPRKHFKKLPELGVGARTRAFGERTGRFYLFCAVCYSASPVNEVWIQKQKVTRASAPNVSVLFASGCAFVRAFVGVSGGVFVPVCGVVFEHVSGGVFVRVSGGVVAHSCVSCGVFVCL